MAFCSSAMLAALRLVVTMAALPSIPKPRWCSDGLELGCDNGEKVRVAFALDCCDREAIGFVPPPKASRATMCST